MKEMITTIISLLRKYNRLWVVNLAMLVTLALCVTALVTNMYELSFGACFLLFMCAWEISDVFLFEKRAIVEEELADTQDKLILAEHEVERLKQELEAAQSELAKQATHVQTGLAQIGQTDEASAETIEAKPKPKRPAFKRKPRPKQTENENKD